MRNRDFFALTAVHNFLRFGAKNFAALHESSPDKGTHIKMCGEDFWGFISDGNSNLYKDIIEPFGRTAKERNEELQLLIDAKLNLFTAEFVSKYCNQFGIINWELLVQDNSGSRAGSNKPW